MASALPVTGRDVLFERRALEHIRATSMPETFSGLDWNPPINGSHYEIIEEYTLDRNKRPNRQMAPCPLCTHGKPKYLTGWLAWFPIEGVYRCVGQDCATRHVGEQLATHAKREYRENKRHKNDYEFAFYNIGLVPQMGECIERGLTAAVEIERLGCELGHVSAIRKQLQKTVKDHNGMLFLFEQKKIERENPRTGQIETVTEHMPIPFGFLTGQTLLQSSLGFSTRLRVLQTALGALSRNTENEAQSWILESESDRVFIHQAASILRRATEDFRRVRDAMDDAFRFFTDDNFERLKQFGMHARNAMRFFASTNNGEFSLGANGKRMRVKPNFRVLHEIPEWPSFNPTT